MKVLVCGAGQVGYGIAEQLSAEGNDVTMIDVRPDLVQKVNDTLEARAFVGNGAHPDVLERAGARDCDMIIAVTLHDEINMVAAQVAGTLFDVPTKIARVRSQTYLNKEWAKLFSRGGMGIDVIISPEREVGEMVLRRLSLPGAFDTDRLRSTLNKVAEQTGRSETEVAAARMAGIPAKRFGNPDEFGAACAFLCSAQAGYITGQNLLIDGGTFNGAF